MATLVLTTVGTMIGGPVGGSIGAMIGQAVDARLFAPKGRQGPRLSDLRVQTSSYGTPVPRLHGRMRVAGTVIWSTDLVEHRNRQGGSKGRPGVTSYSYSASFAVALSSRPVRRVGRIWAEGTLLRGAAGDFKSATGFRLHDGSEDQPVDPLIAAAEGMDHCPAFRGLAYALFEDMDLSPFGNRIPSLTFEVEADDGVVRLDAVIGDVLGGEAVVAAGGTGGSDVVAGAALSAPSRREAIEPLLRLRTVDRQSGQAAWRLGEDGGEAALALGEVAGERAGARVSRTLGDGGAVPRQIGLTLFDPGRDFQLSAQQARVAGGMGPAEAVALPLAMAAAEAKAVAGRLARDAARQVLRSDWPTGFAGLAMPPGTRAISDDGIIGRIAERRIEGAGVRLLIERERSAPVAGVAADGGRAIMAPDALIGASRGWLFDLPLIDGVADAGGRLALAAGGTGSGWRRAAVEVVTGVDAVPVALGSVTAMAALGEVLAIDGSGQPWLFDRAGVMTIELLHDAMSLDNADDAALLAGANLAVAGDELLQFGHAEPLGGRRWRLTQLLRGRYGTEDAMAAPAAGRGFALIGDPALMLLPAGMQAGGTVLIEGQGDIGPLALPVSTVGRAARPLAPVALGAEWQADGGLKIAWIRRSRLGAGWIDMVDAPLDERDERYRVTLSAGAVLEAADVVEPRLLISAAAVAGWRNVAGSAPSLRVAVSQMGANGPSPVTEHVIAL